MEKLFIVWGLLLLNIAVCQKNTRDASANREVPSQSVISGNSTPATPLSPAENVTYTMTLDDSGLAVLDSTIKFRAELKPDNASFMPVEFIYQWMNMAAKDRQRTVGGLSSEISIAFPSLNVSSGDYPVTVAAFLKDNPAKVVAFKTKTFTLTDMLNGEMTVNQSLNYKRQSHVFSTWKMMTLNANVSDQFQKQSQPTYKFYWCANDSFLSVTNVPSYATTFFSPMNYTLKAIITVSLGTFRVSLVKDPKVLCQATSESDVRNSLKFDDSYLRESGKGSVANETEITSSQRGLQQNYERGLKIGQFKQNVVFKDPLWMCRISRVGSDSEVDGIPLEDGALFNITCHGSAPSAVCVNITSHNISVPENQTCKPDVFTDTVQHQIRVCLREIGWHDIHFYIFNDITRLYILHRYYGYRKESLDTPALVIPLVFGLLGIVVIGVGAAYMMRVRKKPLVEVADFDFHPTLTATMQSEASIRLARVVSTIKCLFQRDRYESTHRYPPPCSPATPSQASTSSKELYESL